MKTRINFLTIILTVCSAYFLTNCATTETAITMVDASVPKNEQSLIVVLNARGNWINATLISIDGDQLNVPGAMFYIPSGTRTLSFSTTTSTYVDSNFVSSYSGQTTSYTRTTYTATGSFQITDTFLPRHTYRMVVRDGSNIKIEDITDSVVWLSPQVSSFSPNNGVLTNFATPRGLYAMPVYNGGMNLQYNHQFKGYEPLIAADITSSGGDRKVYYAEKVVAGLSPVIAGIFFQGGLDFGVNKIGLALMAEVNGGVGFGSPLGGFGMGLNGGYLFVGELYSLDKIGVGFGYGKTMMRGSASPAYDYLFPYLRGEVLFFRKGAPPLTVYTNYFYEQNKWALGISANFAEKREKVFSSKRLR